MEIRFGINEILKIAEGVEQREIDFYQSAIKLLDDQCLQEVCRRIMSWNILHKGFWEQKRESLLKEGDSRAYDLSDKTMLSEPGAMAGLTWYGIHFNVPCVVKNWMSEERILEEALRHVKDLVIF